ncbi:MAG: methyl-accepting chemotaxis protein [Erythrobacter sp.]
MIRKRPAPVAFARPPRPALWLAGAALLGAALVGAGLVGDWPAAGLILAAAGAFVCAQQRPPAPPSFIGPMKRRASDFLKITGDVTVLHPSGLPDHVRDDLAATGPFLDILRGQIDGVQHDVLEGVTSVVEQVQHINRLSTGQRERIANSLSGAGAMQGAVAVPGAIIGQLSAMLAERDAAIADNYAGLEALSAEFQELRGALDVISQVADKAFFLAINASVEAHRQGAAGLAFGLIATEMRALATQTSEGARSVSQGINSFADRMHKQILAALPDRKGGEQDEVQRLVRELESAQGEVAAISTRLSSLMQIMESGHGEILLALSDILGRLQFQDVMSQRLGQVADALGEFQALAAASAAGEPDAGSVRDLIDSQAATYVMASQSAVHAEIADNGGVLPTQGNAALKIELF